MSSSRSGGGGVSPIGHRAVSPVPATTVEPMPTTLVDRLRAADDGTLAALLRLRPDLAVPPPADLTVLATRAGDPRLGAPRLRGPGHRRRWPCWRRWWSPTRIRSRWRWPSCAGCSARTCRPRAVDRALCRAAGRAVLIWDDGRHRAWYRRRATWCRGYPGGLGRPATGPAGSSALPELLAEVDADERRVLDALAAGPPIGRSRAGADPQSPVGRLLARGLLLRVDADTVELPRQVALALRGDRPMGTAERGAARDRGPRPRGRRRRPHRRGRGARGAAPGRAADGVLGPATAPGAALRRARCARAAPGGQGDGHRRDDRRAARRAGRGRRPGGRDRQRDAGVGADHPARRVGGGRPGAALVAARAHLAGPAPAARAGRAQGRRRSTDRRPVRRRAPAAGAAGPAPGARPGWPSSRPGWPRGRRSGWPTCWPGGRPGAAAGCATRSSAGCWPRPRCSGWSPSTRSPHRAGCCSTNPDGLIAALRATLPTPVDHVLLQADLTAVAPGPLEPELAASSI